MHKSTIEEIREKFENAVESYSNLETGQSTAVDSPVFLEVLTESAARLAPAAKKVLDIGCGAGNYTLKLLQKLPGLECTLIDLSPKMLERAKERISAVGSGPVKTIEGDILTTALPVGQFEIVLSGLALHHLREESGWRSVFKRVYESLKPGGVFMISDMIAQADERIEEYMMGRYIGHIEERIGPEQAKWVHQMTLKEDTPRSVFFLLNLLQETGFRNVDILHKNILFAAVCGIKE